MILEKNSKQLTAGSQIMGRMRSDSVHYLQDAVDIMVLRVKVIVVTSGQDPPQTEIMGGEGLFVLMKTELIGQKTVGISDAPYAV